MSERQPKVVSSWGQPAMPAVPGGALAARLLSIVDAGLVATICGAPFFFGGRHDLGRLVFVALVAVTAVTWFVRQSLLPKAKWTRTGAVGVLLLAIAVVALQIVPLPAGWIAWLSPRTAELLPLWSGDGEAATLGTWNTLSFTPTETRLALAMLVSYGLLFIVVIQRLGNVADVRRVLGWIAVAAALMAAFGLVQLFTSNGLYFWFYDHPYRTTEHVATGSFMNRNHFASFLVLGVGPLVAWLVATLRDSTSKASRHHTGVVTPAQITLMALFSALIVVLLAVALSRSRGGAIALATASVVIAAIYWRWRLVDVKYLYGLVAVGLVMLGLLSIYGYDDVAARLDDLTEGTLEAVDRESGRRTIWAANVAAIRAGGLTGGGAASHEQLTPIYLPEAIDGYYTHAENSYLQIVTENGWLGAALLIVGMGLCGWWWVVCMRRLRSPSEQLCFGAAAAGLAASAVHSLVDFVWFIPATMSVTLVLAACTLRLSQFALPDERRAVVRPVFRRARWTEASAVVALAGAWSVYAYFGPAMASLAWDRYLRAEVAHGQLTREQWTAKVEGTEAADASLSGYVTESMVRHLEEVVRWNPNFAVARFELAQRYLDLFELRQQKAENAMGVAQIADAAAASRFASPEEMRAWLGRALGENAALLNQAHQHVRVAIALCPLKGEAYVLLANLSFLDDARQPTARQLAEQGSRVRPRHCAVLFEMGRQRLAARDLVGAIQFWSQCANEPGPHQLRIVHTLAGPFVPAAEYIKLFHPDWQTLRDLWSRYRQLGQPQDLANLAAYAQQVTERQALELSGTQLAYTWLFQATMYDELKQSQEALVCLEKAYRAGPHIYPVRFAIGESLMEAGRYAEAEPHVRWCLARRPENKGLSAQLVEITKQRYAQRATIESQ